jgi:hypothetical protein
MWKLTAGNLSRKDSKHPIRLKWHRSSVLRLLLPFGQPDVGCDSSGSRNGMWVWQSGCRNVTPGQQQMSDLQLDITDSSILKMSLSYSRTQEQVTTCRTDQVTCCLLTGEVRTQCQNLSVHFSNVLNDWSCGSAPKRVHIFERGIKCFSFYSFIEN